jgi:Flp pilus assembly protein TadB
VATVIFAVMLLLGAGVGLGLLLIIAGLQGRAVFGGGGREDDDVERRRAGSPSSRLTRRWLVAGAVGAVAWLITGWFAAALIGACSALMLPRMFGGQGARREWIAKTQAIATWTEMLRDTMAAADGVEEAIAATVPIAPQPIRREVGLLDARRRSEQPLTEALAAFGREIDHPSADLVVASLSMAASGEGSDFVGVLTRLATMTRDESRMYSRIEASRATVHTSGRIILVVFVGTIVLISLISRDFMNPYGTIQGQLWLVLVGTLFCAGVVTIDRMSQIELPERFTPRRIRRGGGPFR